MCRDEVDGSGTISSPLGDTGKVDEIGTELASLTQLASQSHPIELLDALPHLLESQVDAVDVGLYDLQRRRLISMGNGRPIDIDEWPMTVPLEHHGNQLGRLLVRPATIGYNENVRELVQALAPVVALNITSSYDFNDRPWTTVRTKEMSLAAEIQATVVPPPSCRGMGFAVSAAVEPAYDTGGDIYEYSFDNGRLFLAVLDAMGHGLQASILASLATAALRRARREGGSLTDVLTQVDQAVRAQYEGSAYVSALVADVDLASGTGRWVSAGHLPPLLSTAAGIRELPLQPALPLGMWITGDEAVDAVPVGELKLEPGESLILYSDGVIENLLESADDLVGDDRFRAELEPHSRLFSHRCARDVVEALLKLTGPVLRDDATLMIAHRSSSSS